MVTFPYEQKLSGTYSLACDVVIGGVGSKAPVAHVNWRLVDAHGMTSQQGSIQYENADWFYFAKNFNTWSWLFDEIKTKAGVVIPDGIVKEVDFTGV